MSNTLPVTEFLLSKYYELSNTPATDSSSLFKWLYHKTLSRKQLLISDLSSQKKHAISYDQWNDIASRLDDLTGLSEWKTIDESSLYNYKLLQDLTIRMRHLRTTHDYHRLLYLIRTKWVRNLGNMNNVNLYRHSHTGTKQIIHDYLEESQAVLTALIHQSNMNDHYLLGILQQTRRNIGRTALVLSGGSTFGLFHIGVLAALFESDLMPKVISGSSAGAIVASIFCVHTTQEIPSLLTNVLNMEFNIFNDDNSKSPNENLLIKISRFCQNGTWFNNQPLINTMLSFLGNLTFREAYNKTGKILNITVSPASIYEQPKLLNNLTAPNVLIWSAVCASCSLPGVFPSTPLFEKDPHTGKIKEWGATNLHLSNMKFMDGSVDNDMPISRLSEMFNVDHIIACQVNIHVFPLLKFSNTCVGGEIEKEITARFRNQVTKIFKFFSDETIHFLDILKELEFHPYLMTKLKHLFLQQYSGNVTILPDLSMVGQFHEVLKNPSQLFLLHQTTLGARATWPKISMIQNNCGQEFALDKAITFLKEKIIISSSIKNPLQFYQPRFSEQIKSLSIMDADLPGVDLEESSSNSLSIIKSPNKTAAPGRFPLQPLPSPSSTFNKRKMDMLSPSPPPSTSPQRSKSSFTQQGTRQKANSLSFAIGASSLRLKKSPLKVPSRPQFKKRSSYYNQNMSAEMRKNRKKSGTISSYDVQTNSEDFPIPAIENGSFDNTLFNPSRFPMDAMSAATNDNFMNNSDIFQN
ncbi:Tgl5p [Saccharomyces cerevisiae YJM1304]|uniref:Patatin-like phospholipase domain-containing protein n=1 Tax=Saccharomyces cerevisiae (strain YJM789) TaxID=307796 RepID=A6ZNT3_YEAS7|nr:Tgl5p [Saccharomyces cerevisiae YJM689]AJT88189.1 Tgl5p [Saccharomyces cerevisiae YJM1133]AJT89172.1 Tgl5p [Saccharomyces cerevisiae YJM1199]AJT93489.1 Tgl5p [Saccharomyces cerevisiae YJM1304]AJT94948.1 Tgl5p [Saccharomyces cerevisiae YJM1326]EDN63948.1 triacylglycerol lipase [Saccharomyces cerevisiae YJM789]CAI4773663.1 CPG_1a_G0050120.mRNA.1.CDS.1 [Saccharomyces cerevisiae]